MQIALRRDDEHMIGREDQSVCDQFNWHFGVQRENLMELGGHHPQMINDDDRDAQIGRQVP